MRKEGILPLDSRLKVVFVLGALEVVSLLGSACTATPAEAAQVGQTEMVPTATRVLEQSAPRATTVPRIFPLAVPELDEAIPMGLTGEDIKEIEDISRQTSDFNLWTAPNAELIKYLYDFKEVVQVYAGQRDNLAENPFTQGKEFSGYVYVQMVQRGYGELLNGVDGEIALNYLADYYKNVNYEDRDGNRETVQCMVAQIFASAARSQFAGAPVFLTSHAGDALALAKHMLDQPDKAPAPDIRDGYVVRFPGDRFEISLVEPGDTIALRYADFSGHVVVVLAKAHNDAGEEMVLVFGSNRVVQDGELITNGIPELRWETSEFFSAQNETSMSQAVIIRSGRP